MPAKAAFLLCLVCLFSTLARAEAPSQKGIDLVVNGGFEQGETNGVPDGWTWGSSSPKANATMELSTDHPHSGEYCVKFTADQPVEPQVYGTFHQTIPCEPMTEYIVSLWVRAVDHGGNCWYGGGAGWQWRNPLPHGKYDWQPLMGWYRTGPDETQLPIMINLEGRAEAIWIDDVQVVVQGHSTDPTLQPPIKAWEKDKILAELGPIEANAAGWRQKLDSLAGAGARVDYPLVRLSLIESFVPRIHGRVEKNQLLQATIMTTELAQVAKDLAEDLAALEKDPKAFPPALRYRTGPIEIDGYAQIGNVLDPATGRIVRRPVIFTGYGNFFTIVREIPQWPDRGGNVIGPEMGPGSYGAGDGGEAVRTVEPQPDGTLQVSTSAIAGVVEMLNQAAEHNVAVSLLISPHYMPAESGGAWNTDHPGVWSVFEAYMHALLPAIRDIPSLHSIILSNEPHHTAIPNDKFFMRHWFAYLQHRYKSIDDLNRAYGGAEYRSFYEVPLPPQDKIRPGYYAEKDRPWLYDRNQCNNLYFADWHRRLADIIHTLAPNVKVHAKITGGYMMGWGLPVGDGCDPEMFADFTNYCGFDDVGGVRITYDVFPSFLKAPQVNSENHIHIPDGNFNAIEPQRYYADLFAQAMHGQTVSIAWCYEPNCGPMADWDLSIRPAAMAAIGRCGLDLMRAAPAMAAIQEAPRRVAIIYSPASFYYHDEHHALWRAAWEAFFATGLRVRFLSENQIARREFGDVKVLILPEARVVEPRTVEGLGDFVKVGGKVISVGRSLEFCTPGWTPVDPKRAETLLWKRIDSQGRDWARQILAATSEAGVQPAVELALADGQEPSGVHWLCGTMNGKKVVAVLNMSGKPVDLTVQRLETKTVIDLIADRQRTLPVTVSNIGAAVWQLP